MFVYKGYRVKVEITAAKKQNFHSRSVKLRSATTAFLYHRAVKFACSMEFSAVADRMVWPPSLSRDQKWPLVTTCPHSRVVDLRLEGDLVFVWKRLLHSSFQRWKKKTESKSNWLILQLINPLAVNAGLWAFVLKARLFIKAAARCDLL